MKLLFFASDYNIGLSTLLTDQAISLYKNRIEILIVAGENEQEHGLTEKIKNAEVPLIRIIGLDSHHNFKQLCNKVCQIIVENDIKLIHVQNNWQLTIVTLAKLKMRKKRFKVIYTLHGFRHNSFIKSIIAKIIIGTALLLFTDKVICMCSYLKNQFKLLSYKIVLLPLGVSDKFFEINNEVLPENGLQMIFPAQFRKGKNQDMIIRAFAKHISNTGDMESHLTLPGSGILLEKMKALTSELNISDRVDFPGQCTKETIYQLYLKNNIGIISSNTETFGQSIVEPFVLGRCIISTPVGIALDIIKDGENGYLFNSESELVSIFDKLFNEPDSIKQMGNHNFTQRNQFKWDKISTVYKECFINENPHRP